MSEDRFIRAILAVRNGLANIVEELNTILGEIEPMAPATAAKPATMHVTDKSGKLWARILQGPDEAVVIPVETLQLKASDPAFQKFLIPKILEALKAKHRIDYTIGEAEGMLREIRLKGAAVGEKLEELKSPLAWAFEKASESGRKEPESKAEVDVVENVKAKFPEDLSSLLTFEKRGEYIIARPRQYLGSENFSRIAKIVRDSGGEYVSAGPDSHFRVGRK